MTEKRFSLSERDLNEINNTNAIADNRIPCTQRQIVKLLNELHDENEQLKTENTMLKEYQNINCQNCQYFVSDSVSSDCLKREDIGYKGTCIDGMDLHMLANNCPYY